MLKLNRSKVLGEMHLNGYKNQEDLANALGISRVWLSTLINGNEQPTTDVLLRMCSLFNCSIDDLVVYPKAEALPSWEMAPAAV